MRITVDRKYGPGVNIRVFGGRRGGEIAWCALAPSGLCAQIEFPSDWHEDQRGWVRLGFGLFRIGLSFPWPWVVPDEYQCSGPTYGFVFFDDGLHLHWGKTRGLESDPFTVIRMPWAWRHQGVVKLTGSEDHPYSYTLRSGEVQNRVATIYAEQRTWTRPWLPWKRVVRAITVDFRAEVGERSGSWKGGVLGCGYEMRPGESPLDTLRRMEAERKF